MSDDFVIRGEDNVLDFQNMDDSPNLFRPLFELVSGAEEFCDRMGFPVFKKCYDGVPVASIKSLDR